MGQASSSSSAASAIDNKGAGTIGSNPLAWIVGALVVLVLGVAWFKRRKGKS